MLIAGPWPKRGLNGFNGRARLRDHRKVRRGPEPSNDLGFTYVSPPHGWPELQWLSMLLYRRAKTYMRPRR